MTIGCVRERPEAKMEVKGRDAKTGLAKTATVDSSEMLDVLRRPARIIADEVLSGPGADLAGAGGGYLPQRHRDDRRRQSALGHGSD